MNRGQKPVRDMGRQASRQRGNTGLQVSFGSAWRAGDAVERTRGRRYGRHWVGMGRAEESGQVR